MIVVPVLKGGNDVRSFECGEESGWEGGQFRGDAGWWRKTVEEG
jgi:hypothetical protein